MTEIHAAVDLPYPVDLVWRALTEPPLLARWFVDADLRPRVGATFRLHAPGGDAGLAGFDATTLAEVTEVEPPYRLVMSWRSERMQTIVTWALTPAEDSAAGGCRLDVTQVGFLGVRGTHRRAALRATYERLYSERLPAVLAELAGGPRAVLPPLVAGTARRSRPTLGKRLRSPRALVAAGAVIAVAAVGVAVVSTLPSGESGVAGPRTGAAPSGAAPSGTATADARASATPTGATPRAMVRGTEPPATPRSSPRPGGVSPSAPVPVDPVPTEAGPARLGAGYRTVTSGLLSYTGAVTVANGGGNSARSWSVEVTLPPLATVTSATASHTQSGTTVLFTGGTLEAGAAVEFTFDVLLDAALGVKQPISCEIADSACTGL